MPYFLTKYLVYVIAASSACFIAEKVIYRRPLTEAERFEIISQIKIDDRK